MKLTVKRSIPDLTRRLNLQPDSEAALFTVLRTVRDASLVDELFALLESSSDGEHGDSVPDRIVAELYYRIAKRSSDANARELCRTALDLYPVHTKALSLFEEVADASYTDELCARYLVFLEDAPSHGIPAQTCAAVLEKLQRAERAAGLNELGQLPSDSSIYETPNGFDEASLTSAVRDASTTR